MIAHNDVFLVQKTDFRSYRVIVRHENNSITNVDGFISEQDARDWIKNERASISTNVNEDRVSHSETIAAE
jgi:hypothetical protein